MKTETAPVTLKTVFETEAWRGPGHYAMPYKGRVLVEGSNNASGWGYGGWTAEGKGRAVDQGPLVQGPYAFAFGLCTVIDNHGGTAAEIEQAKAEGRLYHLKAGDNVEIAGTVYKVVLCKRGYVKFAVV